MEREREREREKEREREREIEREIERERQQTLASERFWMIPGTNDFVNFPQLDPMAPAREETIPSVVII